MDKFEKSSAIKSGLRKGFRDGSSKMARRRCYGYSTAPDGHLLIDPAEAETVRWIFQRYLEGDSLMERYLYTNSHEAIISDELFAVVHQAKQERAKSPRNKFTIDLSLW